MEEIDKKFIDIYREISRMLGMDELLSIIFARLYIEPEEIAMEDLAKETGYSLASISNKVNMLGSIWPIKKFRKPGTKKIFLYLDKSIVNILKETMLRKQQYSISVVKEKLPSIIKEYKTKAKSSKDKKKLEILENYYKQVLKLEEVLEDMVKAFDKIVQ